MNIRDLRYMLAVAEHRHFGRAAEACRVSQPTLSVQLRKLEEALGVVLFERSSKQVVPTPICELLLAHARIAVAETEAMTALAQASADPLRGALRIGIIPTLGPYLLPLVFAPLREALPELEIEPWEDITATLINMVAAGYGTTLVPGLAAGAAQDSGIALRPLAARASRTIRIVWRAAFPRRAAVESVARVIADRLAPFAAASERDIAALDCAPAARHVAGTR